MIRKGLEKAKQESPLDVIALGSLKAIKMDLGIIPGAVIGLELDVLPYNNYSRVQHVLDDSKFVDISGRIKNIRSMKVEGIFLYLS